MKVYLFECVNPYERLVFATYLQAVDHFISFITNSPENFDEDDREMLVAWIELQTSKRWQDYLKEDLPLKDFNEAFCELATITEIEFITSQ